MNNVEVNCIFEQLEDMGNDVNGALLRVLDDKDLYLVCLNMLVEDESIKSLGVALNNKNIDDAFDSSHRIKGILANMGLTVMYDITNEIVNKLRNGTLTGVGQLYTRLVNENNKLRKVIKYEH